MAFLLAFLPGFVAFAERVCCRDALADLADVAGALLRDAAFEDFLRVFLDIRLPFVAFRGSTIGVLRAASVAGGFASLAGQV